MSRTCYVSHSKYKDQNQPCATECTEWNCNYFIAGFFVDGKTIKGFEILCTDFFGKRGGGERVIKLGGRHYLREYGICK